MTTKPNRCVLWSWRILLALAALPLTAAIAVILPYFSLFWQRCLWLLWGGILLVTGCVYLPLRWRSIRFSLTADSIEMTSGVIWITTRCIHRDAVRQVTLLQGPIERRCRTAFLLISGTGGSLLVEGISLTQAEDWCRRLYPQ